jgi:ubiquinone/menaquinone biosynthesis C-methylase UbiE
VPELDPLIARYYERGAEIDRLAGGFPSGPLEFERTKELLLRHLPPPPGRVLDVGGGPGAYAAWMADLGYQVHVVDSLPLHVEQAEAAHPSVTAELGDARRLRHSARSVDAVLLLGPLYHLVDRGDRIAALREAHRVVRRHGVVIVAAISRFAALLDLLLRLDRLHEPAVERLVGDAVETGVHRGADVDLFTTAYFHRADELVDELEEAALVDVELFNVEGPGFAIQDFAARWDDPDRREAILDAARLVEREPTLMGMSSHLLAVGRPAPPSR